MIAYNIYPLNDLNSSALIGLFIESGYDQQKQLR